MPESIPPLFTIPAGHSPEERVRAVAVILAACLLRLRRSTTSPETPPPPAPEPPRESSPNHLAVFGEKSVTLHAG